MYSIHFYLLERLSNISIFSIIPELHTYRDELLKMLVQAAYDIAGDIALHHATSKVTDHLTSIICSVIEDMALLGNGIQVELLDLMVCALCQEEKKKNQNGYFLMRKVISSCPNNFQPFLERQLHQVTALLWSLATICCKLENLQRRLSTRSLVEKARVEPTDVLQSDACLPQHRLVGLALAVIHSQKS